MSLSVSVDLFMAVVVVVDVVVVAAATHLRPPSPSRDATVHEIVKYHIQGHRGEERVREERA